MEAKCIFIKENQPFVGKISLVIVLLYLLNVFFCVYTLAFSLL